MNMAVKNILIVGVGGQGTLLASKIMGRVYLEQGFDVKVSEVHGMSQRGGSVVTYVRYGDKVWSPVIDKGEADIIISFEQLESARWLSYLKPGGVLISSTQKLDPAPVIMGQAEYPKDILDEISSLGIKVVSLPADELAEKAGSTRSANIVLLGASAKSQDIPKEVWLEAIKASVPPKTLEANLRAFELGFGA